MDWTTEETLKVITLYKKCSCLWDFKSPEYKEFVTKKDTWRKIARRMHRDEEVVRKKIKNLRTAYLLEKKKVDASKKSGCAADDIYEPRLFYFSEMSFLDATIGERKNTSNIAPTKFSPSENSNLLSDDSTPSFSDSGTRLQIKRKTHRVKLENAENFDCALDEIITQVKSELRENDCMFLAFGKSIGMQLSKLPLILATETMAEIQKLVAMKMQKVPDDRLK